MCMFSFILHPTARLEVGFLEGRVSGRQFAQHHFSCPKQPMAFAKLSALNLSSSLLISLCLPLFFFSSWGSPVFIKSPLPLSLQTQPRYPCQIHWSQPEEVNMEPIDYVLFY